MPPPPLLQVPTSHHPSSATVASAAIATTAPLKNTLRHGAFATITIADGDFYSNHDVVLNVPDAAHESAASTIVITVTRTVAFIYTPTSATISAPTTTTVTTAPTAPAETPLRVASKWTPPDWPTVAIFCLIAWIILAWVVAVVLFFSTFPEKYRRIERFFQRRYRAVGRWFERTRGGLYRLRTMPERFADDTRLPTHQDGAHPAPLAVATGLGISFGEVAQRTATPRFRRMQSFDGDAFEPRSPRPGSSFPLTAPLPNARSFTDLRESHIEGCAAPRNYQGDLESGLCERGEIDPRDAWVEDQKNKDAGPSKGGVVAVLESVSAVIDWTAGKVANMASEPLTGRAEEGLLLPVREEERKKRHHVG